MAASSSPSRQRIRQGTLPGGQRRDRGLGAVHRLGCDLFRANARRYVLRTQTGIVMQADRTGYDDGRPYVAVLVGGGKLFESPSQTLTWRQARASFTARAGEPFVPQLSGTVDYVVTLPPPPNVGPDPGLLGSVGSGVMGYGDLGCRHATAAGGA